MNLAEIVWPVFRLGEKEPHQHDGLVFYYTEYVDKEQNEVTLNTKLVDDANLSGKTLGLRRLQLKSEGHNLHRISTAIYLLADLVKLAKASTWFIDTAGRVFHYEKKTRAKLVTKKIKQVLPADGIGCVIEIEGVSSRFKSLVRPTEFQSYAVVLKLGMGFMLYGFSESALPDSWRMV